MDAVGPQKYFGPLYAVPTLMCGKCRDVLFVAPLKASDDVVRAECHRCRRVYRIPIAQLMYRCDFTEENPHGKADEDRDDPAARHARTG